MSDTRTLAGDDTARKPAAEPKHEHPETIAASLERAAHMLRGSDWSAQLGPIAWLVADGGADLRELIVRKGITGRIGVDRPTGSGALLPKRRQRERIRETDETL